MATKKQRRRRQKDRRHEWEYVYVDGEGEEVEVDEPEPAKARRGEAKVGKAVAKGGKQPSGRGGRRVDPPSWRKVGKRGLLFAPLMLIVVYLLQHKNDYKQAVIQTVVLMAFFIPFSYLMDTMMYRAFRKRMGGGDGARAKQR